jgi:hypothetical protein
MQTRAVSPPVSLPLIRPRALTQVNKAAVAPAPQVTRCVNRCLDPPYRIPLPSVA